MVKNVILGFFIDMKFKSNYDNWLLKNENGRLNTESMSFDVVNCCTVRAKASSENVIHSFYIHLIFIRSFWSSGIDAYSATITHFCSESLNEIHDLYFSQIHVSVTTQHTFLFTMFIGYNYSEMFTKHFSFLRMYT